MDFLTRRHSQPILVVVLCKGYLKPLYGERNRCYQRNWPLIRKSAVFFYFFPDNKTRGQQQTRKKKKEQLTLTLITVEEFTRYHFLYRTRCSSEHCAFGNTFLKKEKTQRVAAAHRYCNMKFYYFIYMYTYQTAIYSNGSQNSFRSVI